MSNESACFDGWTKEAGNNSGTCCCNCKWLRPIAGHPWNRDQAFYGRIGTVIAWGCTVPEMENIVLMERQHSMCEMHTPRDLE